MRALRFFGEVVTRHRLDRAPGSSRSDISGLEMRTPRFLLVRFILRFGEDRDICSSQSFQSLIRQTASRNRFKMLLPCFHFRLALAQRDHGLGPIAASTLISRQGESLGFVTLTLYRGARESIDCIYLFIYYLLELQRCCGFSTLGLKRLSIRRWFFPFIFGGNW